MEDRAEQVKFVNDLIEAIRQGIMKDFDAHRIPAEWDGLELRQLIADRAADAAYVKMSRGRKASYRNTVIVNNL